MIRPKNPFSELLEEDAALSAALLDQFDEGVVIRLGKELKYANRAALRMMGFSDKNDLDMELLNRSIFDWVHPDDHHKVEEKYKERLSQSSKNEPYSFRMMQINGNAIWLSCVARLIQWQGQIAVAATLSDITSQLENATQEKISTHLFQSVFNATPDFMLLFRLDDGAVLDVNPSFLNIFGHRRDVVVGQSVRDLNLWSDHTFHERFIEELKTSGSITDMPTTMNTRGDVLRHFRLYARRVDGTILPFVLITGRDVTEDLSRSIELQRNRDAAELANRSKSEFLANMSHELRTPLNAILGFSELIRDQIAGPNAMDRYISYAEDIHRSGRHLLSIINDILDLSKVEAGRLEAHMEWLDPSQCFAMCLKLMQHRAGEVGVTLIHDFDTSLELYADERLLKQICLNLLSNAVKFTEVNGQVAIKLFRLDNGRACLSVEDTGIGMTAEEIQIAQRPFGQVDSSLSRAHEGSGLGLPLVVSFSAKMQCAFNIDSAPGVGTCVKIAFPSQNVREMQSRDDLKTHHDEYFN